MHIDAQMVPGADVAVAVAVDAVMRGGWLLLQ
jgi:hypothetical protein